MSAATSSTPTARLSSSAVNGGSRPAVVGSAVRAPRPGRPTGRVVLAVLLIVAGAAIGAALYLAGDDRTQVVVAARDIPVGTVISAGDLTAGEISGEGVGAIAGQDASRLLGQTATTRIPAGALLHAEMVDPAPPPGPGRVAVGLSLSAGQLPTAELAADRLVQVIQVPAAADAAVEAPQSTVLVPEALVLSVGADPSGAWLVTVAVASEDAPAVSASAAAGRVTLGLLPVEDAVQGETGQAPASEAGQG